MAVGWQGMKDAISQLRSPTGRAKSDVANKLISMFLHNLSRKICREWGIRVDSEKYLQLVRERFGAACPYCLKNLAESPAIIEHLDGMNRYRVGLHIPGNVLIACKRCNNEKRRDDSRQHLILANCGWASFLSHDGTRCDKPCATCNYWATIWEDETERKFNLLTNRQRIEAFRKEFPNLEKVTSSLVVTLPGLLTKLYSDCQHFAESEITKLLQEFDKNTPPVTNNRPTV